MGDLEGLRVGIWVHELVDRDGRLMVGGVQTYVFALAGSMSSSGASVEVIHPGPPLAQDEQVPIPGIRAVAPDVWKAGSRSGYDVGIAANCHARPGKLPGRTIGIQHGIYWDRPSATVRTGWGPTDRLASAARAVHHHRVVERYDHLVCVDYNFPNCTAALRPPLDWSKLSVIPNFAPEAEEPDFDRPVRRLVFSRRFVRHRGTDVFADAVRHLRDAGWEGAVALFGEGPEEEELRRAFDGLDGVSWGRLSYQNRLEAFSADAVAVVPSVSTEGTSLTCLEAWARGSVVASTPVGGLSNLVVDGVTGFLAPPDGRAFGELLLRIVDLPIATLSTVRDTAFRASQGAFGLSRWRRAWRAILTSGDAG